MNFRKDKVLRKIKRSKRTVFELIAKLYHLSGKSTVHFIHVGKTGGTAIKFAFRKRMSFHDKYIVIMHNHRFRMKHLPEGELCFFVVRDPVSRFVSGFYSRQRMGGKNNNPWEKEERRAFSNFSTPQELAMALGSDDPEVRAHAVHAMTHIGHVQSSYWDWFHHEVQLKARLGDIVFVLRQENLEEDFSKLVEKLELKNVRLLPKGSEEAHKTPEQYDKRVSGEAVVYLKEWYRKEYEFLSILFEEGLIDHCYE